MKRSKQNRLTSAKQNTVGDFISKLRITVVLTGFFWSLLMLYSTLTAAETRNYSANYKIVNKNNKLLFPQQLTVLMLMLASYAREPAFIGLVLYFGDSGF